MIVAPFRTYDKVGVEITKLLHHFYQRHGRSAVGVFVGQEEYIALAREIEALTRQRFNFVAGQTMTINGLAVFPKERPGIDLGMDAELTKIIYDRNHSPQPPSGAW